LKNNKVKVVEGWLRSEAMVFHNQVLQRPYAKFCI